MKPEIPEHSISIIIPVYNGGKAFIRCLDSVTKASPPAYEIIVVGDGDTDGSSLLAQQYGAKVLRHEQSQGPAKARNLGASSAQGDILFFVDADVEIYPDTIEKVAKFFANNADYSALIGSYDDSPGEENFLSQYKNLFHHYTHQKGSEEASTFWGACGGIKRDIFLKVGGFDESYRLPCVEDIELGYRLKQLGYQIKLCKDIEVKHLKKWEIVSLIRADFFYRAIPWTSLLLRYSKFVNDLNLNWSNRISVILVYAILSVLILNLIWPKAWIFALALGLAVLLINKNVYYFFYEKRGILFAIKTIPWHLFYYFYGGLAFLLGTVRYYTK